MKNESRLPAILIAVFLLITFYGCSEKDDELQEQAAPETDSSPQVAPQGTPTRADGNDTAPMRAGDASLNEVIALWDVGQKDQAASRFLSIDWQGASVFQGIPGLTISEGEYLALSQSEQQRVGEETMALLASMRKLFFWLATEAERLAGAGNRAAAEEYLEAVRRYGSNLSGSDHLELVRMHGKAAKDYAEKKLSELK